MGNFGLYNIKRGGNNVLMYNENEVSTTVDNDSNEYGLYINGKKLDFDGANIAEAKSSATLLFEDNKLFLNDIELGQTYGEVINITKEDYSKLVSGLSAEGYKSFEPYAIYNIVPDVSIAPTITYTVSNNIITFSTDLSSELKPNMLYNSVTELSDNTIDYEETELNTNCPFVNVMYFDPQIPVNGTVDLRYYVDTYTMESMRYGGKNDTFTVIVKDEGGNVIAKKTTYAGDFKLTTLPFTTEGETWLSVECIDSNGVGSVVHYFDIWVHDAPVENHYVMQESDLTTFGIVPNNTTLEVAYANKAALTNFFTHVKNEGYNGVKMLNRIYYVDYHKRFSENSILGTQTYKRAVVDLNTRTILSLSDVSESDVIASVAERTFGVSSFPSVDDKFINEEEYADVERELNKWEEKSWIVTEGNDKCIYYVVNTSIFETFSYQYGRKFGDYIEFPDNFTVDLNGATIKAIPTTDIRGGWVIRFDNNKDTHIKNGNIVGNFGEFNFRLGCIREGTSHPAELQSVIATYNSQYCSFEKLNISNTMGYDCVIGGDTGNHVYFNNYASSANDNTRVNLANGEVVSTEKEMIATDFIPINNCKELMFGRHGLGGYYMGKQREIFYSFYDSSYNYIVGKSIKSKLYNYTKVPSGAAYARITAYGLYSDFPQNTGNGWLSVWRSNIVNDLSRNIVVKECNWDNTRTCFLAPQLVRGLLLDSCNITRSVNVESKYQFHYLASDFEDGWQKTTNVMIRNCNISNGCRVFLVYFCEGFHFINNVGFKLWNYGGIGSGFIEGNTLGEMSITINKMSYRPFVYYSKNSINSLSASVSNDYVCPNDGTVLSEIGMVDTTITEKTNYKRIRLVNSKNGDTWYSLKPSNK